MTVVATANSPCSTTLKRSPSVEFLSAQCPSSKKHQASSPSYQSFSQLLLPRPQKPWSLIVKTERHSGRRREQARQPRGRSSMSSQPTRRRLSPQLPTFMSVFHNQSHNRAEPDYLDPNVSGTLSNINDGAISSGPSHFNPNFTSFHKTGDSASTSTSDNSSESSPTTTVSTLDSSSMTDPSPLVSPDSPAAHHLTPSSPDSLRLRRAATENVSQTSEQAFSDPNRPGMAGRRARNLKNLAVNTSQAYSAGKIISTAQLPMGLQPGQGRPQEPTSAPTSPSFIKPPSPPKRKPTNLGLTIMTPAKPGALPSLAIPSTPSFNRPQLRHFQSSPSLPLMTPSLPPQGGMRLPALTTKPQPRGFAEVPLEDDEEPEPNFDIPQSREEKPEAYPDGPIRIYESGVDLFLEPSAEVASRYDVVMNVASEVKNPFETAEGAVPTSTEVVSNVGVLKDATRRQSSSPTTPKATPLSAIVPSNAVLQEQTANQPEYIHIPWEHNTDIVPDLHRLVKVIDERVQQGKNVLVHCQCGVSRSASLIVAYGLYKNQDLSVQEAYDAVKRRSKWIGPNMNLIMQLQEFKAGLRTNQHSQPMYSFQHNISSTTNAGAGSSPSGVPHTAPLQTDISPQRASTGNIPLSAGARKPSQLELFDPTYRRSWGAGHASFDVSPSLPVTPYVDPCGHIIPVLDSHVPEVQYEVPPVPSVPKVGALNRSKRSSQEQLRLAEPSRRLPSRKSVPNFSRQLPLRSEGDDDELMTELSAKHSLASPRSTQFAMTSIHLPEAQDTFNLFSPMAASFQEAAPHSQQAPLPAPQTTASSTVEKSTAQSDRVAFSSADNTEEARNESFGLFSPMQTSFPQSISMGPTSLAPRQDSVQQSQDVDMGGLASPRSEMFGMTGLSHQDVNDGFGVLSPMQNSFLQSPWDVLHQPQQSNFQREHLQTPQPHYERRPSTPPTLTDASSPEYDMSPSPPPTRHLEPAPHQGLRTKFSSPNLAEQRRLQQLQSEIESHLPHHSPDLSQDEDALMSPRATEFTKNPFHFEVPMEQDQNQEAPQNQVPHVVQVQVPTDSGDTAAVDPRSPAQTGINPITRNIFDFL